MGLAVPEVESGQERSLTCHMKGKLFILRSAKMIARRRHIPPLPGRPSSWRNLMTALIPMTK